MKPLSGLRILEFDGLGPVTFAGMMLADMGADVLRLVRAHGGGDFEDVGGVVLHRGRSAVTVDLKNPEDHARVLKLVESSHALIEGFRPGVMERLGLGPDVCAQANPGLVYGRVTGWGQTGPLSGEVGHDINYVALSGALHAMGPAGGPPSPPLNLVGDYGGGAMMLVTGILAALLEARSTGRGRTVDAAMTDGAALLTALFHGLRAKGLWSDSRGANLLDGGAPFYRCYACRDGRFVAVGALEPRFYAALIAGLGLTADEAPQHDMSGWPALHARFEALFATRDRDDWSAAFAGTDACVTPVLSLDEAPRHPHLVARRTFTTGEATAPGPAPRFSGIDGGSRLKPQPLPMSLEEALARWS